LADVFDGFTMDFVDIGDAGNEPDTWQDYDLDLADLGLDPFIRNSVGSVEYSYRISAHEVSRAMIDRYNANSGGPTITMYDYAAAGFAGGNLAGRPATGVSWNEAARFVNWLNTSRGYSAAYNFTTGDANGNITHWSLGDTGYDPANPLRNSNAYYFLPSEDEWYKAAFYDPSANGGTGGYWEYATGSNTPPTPVTGGTASGTAVYDLYSTSRPFEGPALVTDAGGLSPYGTMAQNGNVWEWNEPRVFTISSFGGGCCDLSTAYELWAHRGIRDDRFATSDSFSPGSSRENWAVGFRVVSVPEPSAILMTMFGAMGLLLTRRRP
jgi:formylglycine-generating enzyme required for sulfatase activity